MDVKGRNLTPRIGGRNHETYSEDPCVLGVIGAAYINGEDLEVFL
jgi:hypothetical protein